MEPNLLVGDRLFVSKYTYGYSRHSLPFSPNLSNKRFLDKKDLIKDLFDERFVKMWEFYLASCSAAFRYRDLVVFQLQIVKNFQSAFGTRDYIYS